MCKKCHFDSRIFKNLPTRSLGSLALPPPVEKSWLRQCPYHKNWYQCQILGIYGTFQDSQSQTRSSVACINICNSSPMASSVWNRFSSYFGRWDTGRSRNLMSRSVHEVSFTSRWLSWFEGLGMENYRKAPPLRSGRAWTQGWWPRLWDGKK